MYLGWMEMYVQMSQHWMNKVNHLTSFIRSKKRGKLYRVRSISSDCTRVGDICRYFTPKSHPTVESSFPLIDEVHLKIAWNYLLIECNMRYSRRPHPYWIAIDLFGVPVCAYSGINTVMRENLEST